MWRFCDLHRHTTPNEQCGDAWDPARFVGVCEDSGLDVVAVTDHDHSDRVAEAVAAAAHAQVVVIPGVELSTDRGHVLAIAPGDGGVEVIQDFTTRVGATPQRQVPLEQVLQATTSVRADGSAYAQRLVLIGAHVDKSGSLLANANTLGLDAQLKLAARLNALEVSDDDTLAKWSMNGVKQGPRLTLLRGSDAHDPASHRERGTWLYLPEISAESMRHAFAIPEASVCLDKPPTPPPYVIESVNFVGGYHDGLQFQFCERANALVGPPNAGKSLIVDALKFAFGIESDLDAVEQVRHSRMSHCMPDGCVVEVRVRTPEGMVKIARTTGGKNQPSPPFRPIIFGQTELTRRAIAATPSIGLLDLHCPQAHQLQADIDEARADVAESFSALLTNARRAASLRAAVNNPHDGLDTTRAELDELAGTEEVAKRAVATATVAGWRKRTRTSIETWQTTCEVDSPNLPSLPVGVLDTELESFTPRDRLEAISTTFKASVTTAVTRAAKQMLDLLDAKASDFDAVKSEVDQQLADAGFDVGSEVQARLNDLRARVEELEQQAQEAADLEEKMEIGLKALRAKHKRVHENRQELTKARRQACRLVNQSMRTFFAKIDPNGGNEDLDALIDAIKTGTWLRKSSQLEVRDTLDRFRLLERAVRLTQGANREGDDESIQDKIVAEALDRGRAAELAQLACLWPDDALVLAQRTKPPTPFHELTEGLRALAIKEISFATSDLPAITDQPEDAVPTRSVFDSLVPALREQRARRQFIVVSHDANIVVASDVERICVLQANEDNSPHVGNLFDARIREAALEHLEGGQKAFLLRANRYAQLGENVP